MASGHRQPSPLPILSPLGRGIRILHLVHHLMCFPVHPGFRAPLFSFAVLTGLVLGPVSFGKESSEQLPAKTAGPSYPLATEGPDPEPITPLKPEEIRASISRGVDFLLESQLKQGAWGRSANPKYYRIWAPVPGAHQAFRTAVTGLALKALCEVRDRFEGEQRSRVEAAIDSSAFRKASR